MEPVERKVPIEPGLHEDAVNLLLARIQVLGEDTEDGLLHPRFRRVQELYLPMQAFVSIEAVAALTAEVERLEAEDDAARGGCLTCRHATTISNACRRLCGHTVDLVTLARAWRIRAWRVRMGLPSDGHGPPLTPSMVGCPGHETKESPPAVRDPRIRHDADEVVVRLRADIERLEARLVGLDARREQLAEAGRFNVEKATRFDRERHGIEEQRSYARTLLQWLTAELW